MEPKFKPMEFGDIFNYSFRILRYKYILICLVMGWLYLPFSFLQNYMEFAQMQEFMFNPAAGPDGFPKQMLFILVAQMCLSLLMIAGPTRVVAEIIQGREIRLSAVFRFIFQNWVWLKLLAAGVLIMLAVFLGVFALIIGALFPLVVFSMVAPVMIVEKGGVFYALGRSFMLAWNNFGRVIAVLLVSLVLFYVLYFVADLPRDLLLIALGYFQLQHVFWHVAAGLIVSFFHLLIAPVLPVVVTLMYFDLRARREGFDLEKRLEVKAAKGGSGHAQPGTLQG